MIRILYIGGIKKDRFIMEAVKAISAIDNVELLIKNKDNNEKSECDFMLCMYNPNKKNNRYGMPNKLYTALKLGIPIIVSQNTIAEDFIKKYSCGISCEYNYNAFVKLLKQIHKYPIFIGSLNAKKAYKENNWKNDKKELEKIYERSTLK